MLESICARACVCFALDSGGRCEKRERAQRGRSCHHSPLSKHRAPSCPTNTCPLAALPPAPLRTTHPSVTRAPAPCECVGGEERAREAGHPTLLVCGQRDRAPPPSLSLSSATAPPSSQPHLLPAASARHLVESRPGRPRLRPAPAPAPAPARPGRPAARRPHLLPPLPRRLRRPVLLPGRGVRLLLLVLLKLKTSHLWSLPARRRVARARPRRRRTQSTLPEVGLTSKARPRTTRASGTTQPMVRAKPCRTPT